MSLPFISFEEGERVLDWLRLTEALSAGHDQPRAEIGDTFLYRGDDTLLSRSAWIDGLGALVKTATIHPGNAAKDLPTINGAVSLFDDKTGQLAAIVDFHLVTKWKTAGDSLLGALRLARPESREILILGSGSLARALTEAYRAGFPDARITIWSRTLANAKVLADAVGAVVADDLPKAVAQADIVSSATMATQPFLKGAWLQPGQHVDLIGAYRPDMREADDTAITRARLFVDSRATTVGHIGEIEIPLSDGTITPDDILADFYDGSEAMTRESADDITLFKNGGGAHLDLMTTRHILDAWLAG